MQRARFLALTALGEGLTGAALLLAPAVPLSLLLGIRAAGAESLLLARVAGAALVAIGVASGLARGDEGSLALRGVLGAILVYDVAVAAVLAYGAFALHLAGTLLWPAVMAHAVLALWGTGCLQHSRLVTI